MDSNKDEAGKCIRIAEQAFASGDKERALKFLKIALRLNDSLQVDELLAGCEKLDSDSPTFIDKIRPNEKLNESAEEKFSAGLNGEHNYTEQHVQLIGHINRNKDYYGILGVEKNCSVDEIKKAYRKLSLKVHPDKNKTPGSEEAFKKVVKAFKCLSDVDSRRQYDHTGLIEEDEYNHQYNVRRRRRRTGHYSYDADFDADELFRAFFGQSDMFPAGRAYRTGGMGSQRREESTGGSPNFFILLQLLPFLLMFLLAYLHFSEPDYSLHQTYSYSVPMMSEKHGVEFYVKSSTFDSKYPLGSSARSDIENNVIRDYKNLLGRYCHAELQRRTWRRNLPTPHCDKLRNLGLA